MAGISRRGAAAASLIAAVIGLAAASPALERFRGLSLDILTVLRWQAFGAARTPSASHAVVVAIDEETYRIPPFAGTPNVTWTREIGRVLTAVVDGGAKVVGFDIIFPTSIEQSEIPFGEETLGARVRGFDRDYLRALALAARAGKLVLGQIQHTQPILPAPGQRVAVGHQRNIRALNLHSDTDEVIRRVPLRFTVDGAPVPSMSVELAARALGAAPEFTADGTMSLGGYRVPSARPNTLTINFEGGADDIPTFSLADLRACLEKGDTEFFRRNFGGKVVIVGTVLDVEDRKITSKRFATAPEGARAARCALPAPDRAGLARDSIAGVYVHATAVNNLLRREAVAESGFGGRALAAVGIGLLAAFAALSLSPGAAALATLALMSVWVAAATVAFRDQFALPVIEPLIAALFSLGAATGYRFLVADREKRLLRGSFALYLAPALIERMLASSRPPQLGGESRNVTVFFSDLAGFSTLTETMAPADVVALMNEYLSAMTEIIEAHGGFVDKYIGDAIVAVFGAPVDDAGHAASAVRAALGCRRRLDELNRGSPGFAGRKLGQRIGLNSGEALVGNIGSRRRFNYTVMGDTVNLASRLEGANKFYGTAVMAAEATVAAAGAGFAWRELDAIRVKGRAAPVRVFEPLAEAGGESAEQAAHAGAYAEGLARWRARDFAGARAAFARFAAADPAAALFFERAEALAVDPPGLDWEPVTALTEK
ncbi:MAG: adenylate/guanylate cyclase domain-containing protein [Alphaproteobacteria bacterium]